MARQSEKADKEMNISSSFFRYLFSPLHMLEQRDQRPGRPKANYFIELGTRRDPTPGIWLWLWLKNRKGPHMWCVISPSSRCPSCMVTAGWAPGMGGLISRLSIRSLLAVLEMGGNTIPLQFDFKPHRSICWTPYSGSSFYHSFYFNSFFCFFLTLYHSLSVWFSFAYSNSLSLSLFLSLFCSVNVISLFSQQPVFGGWSELHFAAVTCLDGEFHNVIINFLFHPGNRKENRCNVMH